MKRIGLIHWNNEEGNNRAEVLGKAGYQVDFDIFDANVFKNIKRHPPHAVVIDLTRLPAQGRDVAIALRRAKPTRHVPLIFAGGEPVKVRRILNVLPDAITTDWRRIRSALRHAIAHPPCEPVVPSSSLAGYAGKPLSKKLGIKSDATVVLVNAPADFVRTLGRLPEGVRLTTSLHPTCSLTLWFVRSRSELEKPFAKMTRLADQGGLWIAWPKKASGVSSDLSQAIVRKVGLDAGRVDYKICSIDETWSGLLFTRRRS